MRSEYGCGIMRGLILGFTLHYTLQLYVGLRCITYQNTIAHGISTVTAVNY